LVTEQFPELVEAVSQLKGSFVIDGEILAIKNSAILLFNDLQKRLNRKNVTKKLLEEVPVGLYNYDILELDEEDLRAFSMGERRIKLEELFEKNTSDILHLSEVIDFKNWNELDALRNAARGFNSEGLMLKKKSSIYHVGRKKGDWWKWKVDPLTIDAVMIYAQKGSGRRSSKYTDYTFAVKNEEKLVTVAKAYSGLTDVEISEISKWVNKNALEKFGPVRTVKPELVFEIAFEGIAYSKRHKSGVALRFPRMKRWRRDKTVKDIDTIESVKALIDAN
jgi:DNA ligase-1